MKTRSIYLYIPALHQTARFDVWLDGALIKKTTITARDTNGIEITIPVDASALSRVGVDYAKILQEALNNP